MPSYLLISLDAIYTGPWTFFQNGGTKTFFPAFFVECSLMTAPPLVPTLEFLLDQVLFTPAHGPKQEAQHFLFQANWPKTTVFSINKIQLLWGALCLLSQVCQQVVFQVIQVEDQAVGKTARGDQIQPPPEPQRVPLDCCCCSK